MGGVPRHDPGLYEAILLFTLAAILWTLYRRGILRGRLLLLLGVLYGTARFFLDFLRARPGDVTYADGRWMFHLAWPPFVQDPTGWTPAQYIVIGVVAYCAYRLAVTRRATVAAIRRGSGVAT